MGGHQKGRWTWSLSPGARLHLVIYLMLAEREVNDSGKWGRQGHRFTVRTQGAETTRSTPRKMSSCVH